MTVYCECQCAPDVSAVKFSSLFLAWPQTYLKWASKNQQRPYTSLKRDNEHIGMSIQSNTASQSLQIVIT